MCGIAGILSLNNSKIDTSVVENIKKSLENQRKYNIFQVFFKNKRNLGCIVEKVI